MITIEDIKKSKEQHENMSIVEMKDSIKDNKFNALAIATSFALGILIG